MEQPRFEVDAATLEPIKQAQASELARAFGAQGAYAGMLGDDISAERLRARLDPRRKYRIYAWRVKRRTAAAGASEYLGIIADSGPPSVFVAAVEMPSDLEALEEIVPKLAQWFFENFALETSLFLFVRQTRADDLEGLLMDLGFDRLEPEQVDADFGDDEAPFAMRRHTYDAYYGAEAELAEDMF